MQGVGLVFVTRLIFESFVSAAHAVVGDQGADAFGVECFEIALAVLARVGGVEGVGRGVGLRGADDAEQQFLFAARAVGLGVDDDLVGGINGGDAGIALDDAFTGGHLALSPSLRLERRTLPLLPWRSLG